MSMHLIRGVHVTGSKKKQKRKPGWQKAEQEHREWLIKMGVDPDAKPKKREFKEYKPDAPKHRVTASYPSLTTKAIPSNGTKKESPKYTGDYIVGIATMHKSNLVPVGRGDNPTDYATMRRS